MACLDNIVTVGICDEAEANFSGFRLIDAPGISQEYLAKIADTDERSGLNLALAKKRIAVLKVKNSFVNTMSSNAVAADISTAIVSSGDFKGTPTALSQNYQGVVIHKARQGDSLKRMFLKTISFIPQSDGVMTLRIEDGYDYYSYNIAVTAGNVNVIDTTTLTSDGGPFEIKSGAVKVLILKSEIALAKSSITCLKGCGGTLPNTCGWVDGWDGVYSVKSDGFGLVVQFNCECDYDELFCNLSSGIVGELVFLAWQMEVMQEHALSNRFSNIVVYQRKEIMDYWLPKLSSEYEKKWEDFAVSFKDIIKNVNSDCIVCKGIKWVVNL